MGVQWGENDLTCRLKSLTAGVSKLSRHTLSFHPHGETQASIKPCSITTLPTGRPFVYPPSHLQVEEPDARVSKPSRDMLGAPAKSQPAPNPTVPQNFQTLPLPSPPFTPLHLQVEEPDTRVSKPSSHMLCALAERQGAAALACVGEGKEAAGWGVRGADVRPCLDILKGLAAHGVREWEEGDLRMWG